MTLAAEAWTLAFGGLSVDAGLALREAAEVKHVTSTEPGRYAGLLSIADLDRFLASDAAMPPRVSMADGSRTGSAAVPEEEYATEDGRIALPKLFKAFDGGATLVVSQFQEHHPPLARFCRGLEKIFLHPVQANIYLTPPGAQGFRVHHDTHDVLVLQVSGEKTWRLWDTRPIPFATRRTPWNPDLTIPDETPRTLVLRAGEALYVPRGVLHDAAAQAAGGEPSLHITVGLLEPSWADAIRFLADAVEPSSPGLREPFPVWRLGEPGGVDALVTLMRGKLDLLAGLGPTETLALSLLDKLAMDTPAMPARGLTSAFPGPDVALRVADGIHHHVVPTEHGAQLRWGGGIIALSMDELGYLERLGQGCSARDLGSDDAVAFCSKLYAAGLLTKF